MNPQIVIRSETVADVNAITAVTVAAFKTLAISHHTEQFIIEALRGAKALTVSLVAELDGRVIGHIACSPVTISDGTQSWYGLGPVSVLPESQRQGIGKALIREGLSRLKEINAQGCCLVGHPDYYRKFGFKNVSGLVHEGVPPEVFFALSFDGPMPQGTVTFHEGFKANGRPVARGNDPGRHGSRGARIAPAWGRGPSPTLGRSGQPTPSTVPWRRSFALAMRIEHIAIWTTRLEEMKAFYVAHFDCHAGPKYGNGNKGFSSYFLAFRDGARLELMQKDNLAGPASTGARVGLAHFALAVGSETAVRAVTERLRASEVTILSEPRHTGDGYFESTVADPDGNLIEITV